jgi:hypothetical protein
MRLHKNNDIGGGGMSGGKPDWQAIKQAYICGYINSDGRHVHWSLEELAQQYGVSLSAIAHKSADENWTDEREALQRRISQQAIEAFEEEFTELLAQGDKSAARLANAMIQRLLTYFEQADIDEQLALITRYARLLPELVATIHSIVGVERERDAGNGPMPLEFKGGQYYG